MPAQKPSDPGLSYLAPWGCTQCFFNSNFQIFQILVINHATADIDD